MRQTLAESNPRFSASWLATILLSSVAMLIFTEPALALISLTVDIAADVTGGANDCSGGSNGFNYDYTVTNMATVAPMISFQIPLSNVGDVCNVVAPFGWSSSFIGTTLIFQAISPNFELPAGGTQLAGFELNSPLPGVEEAFTAQMDVQGTIVSVPIDPLAPLRIPEPPLWSLMGAGAMATALIRRQRPSASPDFFPRCAT